MTSSVYGGAGKAFFFLFASERLCMVNVSLFYIRAGRPVCPSHGRLETMLETCLGTIIIFADIFGDGKKTNKKR